jgi:hypothetical protein
VPQVTFSASEGFFKRVCHGAGGVLDVENCGRTLLSACLDGLGVVNGTRVGAGDVIALYCGRCR